MDIAWQPSGYAHAATPRAHRPIAVWLLVCCALVFAMVVVGGVTRLTHSGLSIVEWKPLVGTIPPLNEAQWAETFAKYQLTPEFKQVNHAMTVAEFKGIFWWEYFHRLLGRMIGVVFLLPLLWFAARRRLDARLALRLGGIFVLGGLQGAMGWYMVRSGLVDDPRVSHFRLTAHLSIAFLILAAMLWQALDLIHPARRHDSGLDPALAPTRRLAWWTTAVAAYMVVTGGLVAGLRAGFAYNTFPLMNGHWIPPEILMIDPWWMNFFYNMATVQFDHRLGAWALAFLTAMLWWRARAVALDRPVRRGLVVLTIALLAQVSLGIATLLTGVSLPLAAAHQGCAVLLFSAALALNHAFARARAG
ncbi:MAG TPA: COX15/CtaA family protein [Burkholderiaceae bacterium]|nr:COX15/CtaA family protein [Burkholderiaceae bacterium]